MHIAPAILLDRWHQQILSEYWNLHSDNCGQLLPPLQEPQPSGSIAHVFTPPATSETCICRVRFVAYLTLL